MGKDEISNEEFEDKVKFFKLANPNLHEKLIRDQLNLNFKIINKFERKEINMENNIIYLDRALKNLIEALQELLNYPFDLPTNTQKLLIDFINNDGIIKFNQLINSLDNKISYENPYVVYQKIEPQPDKHSISTRISIGANPSLEIVTKKYRYLSDVPIFI